MKINHVFSEKGTLGIRSNPVNSGLITDGESPGQVNLQFRKSRTDLFLDSDDKSFLLFTCHTNYSSTSCSFPFSVF